MGLGDVHRHDRILFCAAVSVHSFPADDFDFRDAHDSAGGGSRGRMSVRSPRVSKGSSKTVALPYGRASDTRLLMKSKHPHLYGVMAQFDNPSGLVAAARETY